MKQLLNIRMALMGTVLALAGTTFTACEDEIDIKGNPNNPWENVGDQFGAVRSAAGARQATTLTAKDGQNATGHVYFELSKVAEQDTKVTFSIDPAALEAYNAANGTSYTAYEGATLENGGVVTIPAGERRSDYVEVDIPAGNGEGAVAITATVENGVTVASNNASYVYQVRNVNIPRHNKEIKNLCYIEVNNENPLNAGEYTLANGEPFFDIVSIFAANLNLNDDGAPYIYCNDQVTYVLQNADKIIRPLQEKGIKVHLSILGNHDDAGMRSLTEEGAKALAQELKRYVDIYGFDGIDFDDEYSSYDEGKYKGSSPAVVSSTAECTNENYGKMLQACREVLPKDKVAFGIYWYRSSDQPKATNLEDLIDYTVFGSYGSYREYSAQSIDKGLQAPYAITLIGEDNGLPAQVPVNDTYLNRVKDNGFKYFAFYNLKWSRLYTPTFDQVAQVLWNSDVKWTGKVYERTSFDAKENTVPTSYESYIGTWSVKPSKALFYYYDETGAPKWWDWIGSPAEFTVTIEAKEEGSSYYVYGWDSSSEAVAAVTEKCPLIMTYDAKYGTLQMTGEVEVPADAEITGNWVMASATYGSGTTWKQQSGYTFRLETEPNGTIQMIGRKDGGFYAMERIGMSLFSVENGTSTAVAQPNDEHPSGAYTFTRK